MEEYNILAIDPATECGWAISRDIYGTINLKVRRDQSVGFKLLRFSGILMEFCETHHVNVIAYEKPGGRNYSALVLHSKLVGIIEQYCEKNKIPFTGYSAGEIKKFATGKGNSNKQAMIMAASSKLGYTGNNDNEADALWILELAKHDLNVKQNETKKPGELF